MIVPATRHNTVLNQLHETHPGIAKMKMLASSHVWCHGIDSDIKTKVQTCNTCQSNHPLPTRESDLYQTYLSVLYEAMGYQVHPQLSLLPSSSGLAKWTVKTFKTCLKKLEGNVESLLDFYHVIVLHHTQQWNCPLQNF